MEFLGEAWSSEGDKGTIENASNKIADGISDFYVLILEALILYGVEYGVTRGTKALFRVLKKTRFGKWLGGKKTTIKKSLKKEIKARNRRAKKKKHAKKEQRGKKKREKRIWAFIKKKTNFRKLYKKHYAKADRTVRGTLRQVNDPAYLSKVRNNGISGAHTEKAFQGELTKLKRLQNKDFFFIRTEEAFHGGKMKHYKYSPYSAERNGTIIGEVGSRKFYKTVSTGFSKREVLRMTKEAIKDAIKNEGHISGRKWKGLTREYLKMQGFFNNEGAVTTFFFVKEFSF